jgi:hypothetical protein
MISKELLSEVLGSGEFNGLKSFGSNSDENYIVLQYEHYDDSINIHELAYMCKGWAYNNFYSLATQRFGDGWCVTCNPRTFGDGCQFDNIDNEPESVFRACEWILENKGQKDK